MWNKRKQLCIQLHTLEAMLYLLLLHHCHIRERNSFVQLLALGVGLHSQCFQPNNSNKKRPEKKNQLFIISSIPVVVIIPIIVVFLFLGVVSKNYCCGKPPSHLTCTLLVREIALNGLVLDINKICPKSVIFW